jgi:glycosyltransferase involved in cell wall biosynthesis
MISIIICSRKSDISEELKFNIQSKIGIEYELIVIDNSKKKYSIFQAYNIGVSSAKYPYLCFMHDDILFHTEDWGQKVVQHFQHDEVGVVGVGGCHYLSKYPVSLLSWELAERNKFYSFNYIQGSKKNRIHKNEIFNNLHEDTADAVALDGMWFCMKKALFKHTDLRFDEENVKGFHFYDFDICMQIHALKKETKIISDILIEHFSTGSFDKIWYDNAFIFYKKWKDSLPIAIGLKITEEEAKNMEYDFVMEFIKSSVDLQDNLNNQIQSICKSKRYRLGRFLLSPISWLKE